METVIAKSLYFTPTNLIIVDIPIEKHERNPLKQPKELTQEERDYHAKKRRLMRFKKRMLSRNYSYMLTVTLRERNETKANELLKELEQEFYKEKNAFVIITELHKDGIPHYHILLTKKPNFINKVGYFRKRQQEHSSYLALKYGLNWFIELPDFLTSEYYFMAQYLSKYLTKHDTHPKYSNKLTPEQTVLTYIDPKHIPTHFFIPYEDLQKLTLTKGRYKTPPSVDRYIEREQQAHLDELRKEIIAEKLMRQQRRAYNNHDSTDGELPF
jgi:hypothetical protein